MFALVFLLPTSFCFLLSAWVYYLYTMPTFYLSYLISDNIRLVGASSNNIPQCSSCGTNAVRFVSKKDASLFFKTVLLSIYISAYDKSQIIVDFSLGHVHIYPIVDIKRELFNCNIFTTFNLYMNSNLIWGNMYGYNSIYAICHMTPTIGCR